MIFWALVGVVASQGYVDSAKQIGGDFGLAIGDPLSKLKADGFVQVVPGLPSLLWKHSQTDETVVAEVEKNRVWSFEKGIAFHGEEWLKECQFEYETYIVSFLSRNPEVSRFDRPTSSPPEMEMNFTDELLYGSPVGRTVSIYCKKHRHDSGGSLTVRYTGGIDDY